jgi:hypothetical protein
MYLLYVRKTLVYVRKTLGFVMSFNKWSVILAYRENGLK